MFQTQRGKSDNMSVPLYDKKNSVMMKNITSIASVLLFFVFLAENLNGQTYRSSLELHYGLFQYNSGQNEFFSDADGNFLNAGLSYRYKLGRLSSLRFTGRYYNWHGNDFQNINTRALQGMWLIHAGRISSSWRVNLITPYVGAGIGYEMHALSQNGSDRDFDNFYLPVEAGMNINLGSRWSLGIFAEYKLDRATGLKSRLGLKDNYQAVANAAGVSVSYHFGQRTTELVVPVVASNPHFIDVVENVTDKPEEIAEIQPLPTLEYEPEKEHIVVEKALEPKEKDSLMMETTKKVVARELVKTITDTLHIPIVIDLTIRGLDEESGRALTMMAGEPVQKEFESKIDSLIQMTAALHQRLVMLEWAPDGQITERETQTVQPIVVAPLRQPYPQIIQVQPSPDQPAPAPRADPRPGIDADADVFATKNDIESLRREIRQLVADNREAMNLLRRDIRAVSVTERRVMEERETEIPVATIPTDTIPEPLDTIPDIEVEPVAIPLVTDTIKPDVPRPELQATLDSLAAVERSLAAELELLKQQNLELMEELEARQEIPEEEPVSEDERISMEYSITFGVNSSKLSDDHLNQIAEFATVLKDNPDLKIQLSGYADATGDPEYNKLLSQWRVQAVRDELIRLGVSQARILEQYFGSDQATGGLNPDDRRVDMQIL